MKPFSEGDWILRATKHLSRRHPDGHEPASHPQKTRKNPTDDT